VTTWGMIVRCCQCSKKFTWIIWFCFCTFTLFTVWSRVCF